MKRLAVLCGTSNEDGVINDLTGNRRIIPINIVDIDIDRYNKINKEDLWMEIYHLFENGFDWMLTKDDIKLLADGSVENEAINVEYDLFQIYFRLTPEGYEKYDFFTCTDIKRIIEVNSGIRFMSPERIGKYLKHKLKVPRLQKKINGMPLYGYNLVQKIDNNLSVYTPEPPVF